ncbi:spore germination protein [Konateibacter massiliensis]|uniref:spore germination protein n=1 Tax=Konateibacter massiliensis TaxID=2002841 RepID=UPI000C14F5FA|nr:spore germination protein [Konateibacter massiliensis]
MNEKISSELQLNINKLNQTLFVDKNYDLKYRTLYVGGKDVCIYFIDGFLDDHTMEKLMEIFIRIRKEDMPEEAHEFSKRYIPYGSVNLTDDYEQITTSILSGISALFIDGYARAFLLDCRNYPMRGVEEPEKDRVLRGSRDGFVETVAMNTALIRRRIRSPELVMEMLMVGESSKTTVVIAYLDSRVDHEFLDELRKRIEDIEVDSLTMNSQSLAECLYQYSWYNPFPKYKFSERPDTAAACILEGNIVILVDNSPSAMITPSSVFDIIEEADDYYFPPVTGSYLRLTKFLVNFVSLALTPVWLLLMQNSVLVPDWLHFIMIQETVNVPLIFQFFILEIAIDGLHLAAVNTPTMLSTPLSIMAALVMGDLSVSSGWFNSEVMLYMAFVAIANYSQPNFELAYAFKFMRMITLVLTAVFNVWGFIIGWIITILAIVFNKTIAGKSYLYPLFPFNPRQFLKRFIRVRLPHNDKGVR